MKTGKKTCLLLIVALCLASITVTAFAETQYQVRLFAGDPTVATLNGSQNQTIGYNGEATFRIGGTALNINDSKYYAKGIREAGKDAFSIGSYIAGETISVPVTRDQDYVVVYGMKKAQVAYTVNCVDGSNRVLRQITYYGDAGDRPLVILPYIDGFNPPGAHGRVSHALDADSAKNVFVAEYSKVTTATSSGTSTTTHSSGSAFSLGSAANAGNNRNTNPATNNAINNAANNNTNNTANNTNSAANTPISNSTPNTAANNAANNTGGGTNGSFQDVVELESVPVTALAATDTIAVPSAPKTIEPTQHSYLPNWMLIAGIVLLVVLIALLYWYLLFFRKRKKYASSSDDYDILDFDDDDEL